MGIFDTVIFARTPIRIIESLIIETRESVIQAQAAKVEKLFVQKQNKETLIGKTRGLYLANIAHHLDVQLRALKRK